MIRFAFGLMLIFAVFGCSGDRKPVATPAATFRDEAEELAYLKSQANPTVEQFRRREVLRAKQEARETTEACMETAARQVAQGRREMALATLEMAVATSHRHPGSDFATKAAAEWKTLKAIVDRDRVREANEQAQANTRIEAEKD